MFVDAHCHLDMLVDRKVGALLEPAHFEEIKNIIKQAYDAKVEKIVAIGTNIPEAHNAIEIAKRFNNVFAVIGFLHPSDCSHDKNWKELCKQSEKFLKNKEENKIIGFGETGLDFFHKPFDKQLQVDVFKTHVELGLKYNLPLVFHVRDASEEFLKVLDEFKKEIRGVVHCFSHKKDFADVILNWGLYVGIDAPITYPKNDWFRELVAQINLDRILLETDAPFLPPQAFRGKKNSPVYIPIIAKAIADLKNIKISEIEEITTKNVKKLFGI